MRIFVIIITGLNIIISFSGYGMNRFSTGMGWIVALIYYILLNEANSRISRIKTKLDKELEEEEENEQNLT